MKGLPLAYNRDLQEDKEPLFDSVDQMRSALAAIAGMIATATFVPERMQAAADSETIAGHGPRRVAGRAGTPFRDAHAIVGALVRRHLAGEGSLRDLVAADPASGRGGGARRARRRRVAPNVPGRRRSGCVPPQRRAYATMIRRERERLSG